MDSAFYTTHEEINDVSMQRPHLVILGAGASIAACPRGDRDGRLLPSMLNLAETLGLAPILQRSGIVFRERNFEEVYGDIHRDQRHKHLVHDFERRISEYFGSLRLPDEPTLYDYLVLSLRPKDVIATFNWDPFLWLTLQRHYRTRRPPMFLFLHGCAIVGFCERDKQQGLIGLPCPNCHKAFKPTRLLYPVADKDYTNDPYIASQWRTLRGALQSAFILTIFGYGAPTSDAAAIDLMSAAWGPSQKRSLEEIEIIDIKTEDELLVIWDRFIHSHHYKTHTDYFESLLAFHPRRSVEALWQSHLEARFREGNLVPKAFDSVDNLRRWFDPLHIVESTA